MLISTRQLVSGLAAVLLFTTATLSTAEASHQCRNGLNIPGNWSFGSYSGRIIRDRATPLLVETDQRLHTAVAKMISVDRGQQLRTALTALHRAAVTMAEVELCYGKNVPMRRLAAQSSDWQWRSLKFWERNPQPAVAMDPANVAVLGAILARLSAPNNPTPHDESIDRKFALYMIPHMQETIALTRIAQQWFAAEELHRSVDLGSAELVIMQAYAVQQ